MASSSTPWVAHAHGERKAHRMKPSELRHAFTLAKQRAARHPAPTQILDFVNVSDHTARVTSTVPVHKPLFEPSPAEVWIDEYTPFQSVTVKLSFRNCDTVARRLKLEPPQSPFFRIAPYPTSKSSTNDKIDGKIAAGMDIAFQLTFSPHDVKEYAVDLVCCTERERFVLPVRVQGTFAALDIPDEVDFGRCPVKLATTRVFLVRNVGTRGAKFAFRCSEHFRISPPSAVLTHGVDVVQLELAMTPPTCAACEGELTITDDAGQTAVVRLVGVPTNVDVYVSQPLVEPSATYISLSSRKSVKICNESEFALAFSWKAFADSVREELERDRLLEELAALESAELEQWQLDNEEEEVEEERSREADRAVHPPSLRSTHSPFDARTAIEHKYKLLRKAAMEDAMQFADESFAVAPLVGRVWPHSEVDVVVSFSPATASLYSSCAHLEIAGQETRLPLAIRGQGIGPRAKVVYNELLDFGEVFISDERTRDFTIQNKGEIPATFELVPVTTIPPNTTITVSPASGMLAVNALCKVEVAFCSNELGDVFLPLRFRLQGSDEHLTVRFKATVIPPVFHFDVDALDFGAVSYSFAQVKTLKLISASKIAMKYSLRIPEEANYKQKEFELLPANGKLDAFGEQEVRVTFTSLNVKAYDYRLVISVTGVGSDLLSIPIKAHCHVPEVVLQRSELDFGTCFLRYPHVQTLVLENKSSHLFGRFEIAEQDDHSRAIASYSASEFSGTLAPDEKVAVDIYLSCEKLGSIRLPLLVMIPGSTELPLAATLTTTATGPKVELDQAEIHWGNCSCLVDHERVLTMTNPSLISAPYKTFIRNARSKFQIDRKDGTLLPGESVAFVLVANLDDTVLFKDQLHILIAEGENVVVPLAIKGVGTTMWSPSELRVVDFGHQMTNVACEWSCTLENKGKRSQVLVWVNRTAAAKRKQLEVSGSGAGAAQAAASYKRLGTGQKSANSTGTSAKKVSKALSSGGSHARTDSGNSGAGSDDIVPVFSVFPASIELKPRTACVFVFKGLSATVGRLQEELVCETRVGKEKTSKVAFVTEICGNFLTPRLAPSASLLAFEYVHDPGGVAEIARQTKPLSLANACELPLSFTLRTQTPFALDCWEAVLQPGEHVDLNVEFYPGFKDDHLCRVINGKIVVAYTGHPQRDSVELVGDISFPNLSFETSKIDFGCTLNDTQKALSVAVTNVSKVDTAFRWVFIEDEKDARTLATAKKPYIPTNQVFDILPIRGHLKPGESEKVEFVFYGHANRKFKSTVACEVDGGPEYELTLLGEASSLVYKLDKQCLDFGPVLFNKTEDREFSILNVGKVPYAFSVVLERTGRCRVVEVAPTAGKIAPNDKQKILVRLRPGVPEPFEETIVLEIAHFQPVEFKLFGVGIFTSVSMNLPREPHPSSTIEGEHPKWRELKKTAHRNLELSTLNAVAVAVAMTTSAPSPMLAASDSRSTISTQPRAGADKTSSTASMPPSPFSKATAPSHRSSNGVPASPTRSSTHASVSHLDELAVETEACRLFFAEYLLVQDAKKSETRVSRLPATAAADAALLPQSEEPHVRATETSVKAAISKQQQQPRPDSRSVVPVTTGAKTLERKRGPDSFPFVLSHFVLDFGNVVLGAHRIRKFAITNLGPEPASFQLDKNLALARGFQVEPERVVRLPEKQAVEFTVTFQARKQLALGVHYAQLPVAMKNGPPCVLTIRATVTIPDVVLSTETLDFGKLPVSTCHTMFTQLHNTSVVAAEWAVKKPMGSAKDLSNFRVTPQSGVLAPGFKVNLQVEFVPDDSRHFALKLPIKVASNPKTRSLTCKGEGSELRLSFHPPMVELGPVLPCADTVSQAVELRNDSDYAVEVFSLDFDPLYKDDEQLLRHLSVFGADGLVNLPLRTPTQPLSAYLMEHGLISADSDEQPQPPTGSEHLERTDEPSSDREAEEGDGSTDGVAREASSSGVAALQSTINNAPSLHESTLAKHPTRPRTGADYIVLGPPRCGKSTQAQLLAEKENVRVWTIDDALPESDDLAPQDDTLSQVASSSLASLLEPILSWRLAQPDLQTGGVLDGFDNAFVSVETAMAACLKLLTAVRVVSLSFDDDDCYEAMAASLKAGDSAKSTAFTPVASKEQLASTNQLPSTVQAAEMAQEGVEHAGLPLVGPEDALHQAFDSPLDDASTHEASDAGDEALEAAVVTEIHDQLDLIMTQASRSGPRTHSEYCETLDATRKLLMHLLAHQGQEPTLDVSPSSEKHPNNNSDEGDSVAIAASPQSAATSDWVRSDHFLLEIPISEPGATLFLHNVIFSALEKHIRELEASHLMVPPPAKYQVLRRPTERFPRKPVSRFQIQTPVRREPSTQLDDADDQPPAAASEVEQQSDPVVPEDSTATTSRWVVPPRSKIDLLVQFASSDVGSFDCSLGFEIVGVRREFTLFCRGVCAVPNLNSDPRNVFMSRVKSRPNRAFVHKKFVLAKNQFEFGPLIVLSSPPKPPETELEFAQYAKTSPNSVDVFRMSNGSAFPLRVDFCLETTNEPSVFAVFPPFLELGESETKELRLWANPPGDGLYENNLVCCVSDNPEPVLFAVSCFGCTPVLKLSGPWEQHAADSTSETARTHPLSARSQADNGVSPRDPTVPVLDFEQLLLTRQDEKTFFIENVSPIAVAWRLLADDLPSAFRLFPSDGTIKPLQKAPVLVVFTATAEAVYKHAVQVQFSDAESALKVPERTRVLSLVVAAEAYKIDVSSFDADAASIESAASGAATGTNGDGSLDFGLVRVGERHVRSFTLRNRGKYNIKYHVSLRSSVSRELFRVEPMEMVLEPGVGASVTVTFQSTHEVALRDCRDIKCTLIEMLSGEPCREFVVFTTVRSVFSVYRVQPNRGINFGPHKYSDVAKAKRIEIRNDGEFPFKYRVRAAADASELAPLALDTQLHPGSLRVGQFTVTPDCGSVDPGVVVGLDVTFQPKDCKLYQELLRVEISGCNPLDAVGGSSSTDLAQYELVGESCFPVITTGDFESIFEEQIVVRSISFEAPASSSDAATGGEVASSLLGAQSVVFAEKERIFSFGAMLAAAASKGTVERFKITNPTKVTTTVQFHITAHPSSTSTSSSSSDASTGVQAFTVQPSVWEIPPLEHRFVSVYFKPTTIASYHAGFSARVDDSPPAATRAQLSLPGASDSATLLEFELRGEGTLPCVSVVEPTVREPTTGSLVLNFDRVRVSKAKDMRVVLRNDGILSATVLLSIQSNPNFFCALGNGSVSVAPRSTETIFVQFKPQKKHDEPTMCTLKITVHNNPFDETTVKLTGTGFKEDVVFEDLPFGHDDELHFGDTPLVRPSDGGVHVATPSSTSNDDIKVFSLVNQSPETIRFTWPHTPPFSFSPALGHLKPRAYKLIRATFAPAVAGVGKAAMKYDAFAVALQAQRIAYKDPSSISTSDDWDENAHQTVSFGTLPHGADERLPEPAYTVMAPPSAIALKCFAAADTLAFECDATTVHFRRTFMLQVCSHRLTVRNTSKITLQYVWRFERALGTDSDGFLLHNSASAAAADDDDDDACPFAIGPAAGAIAAESAQVFSVKFAPLEVDDYWYVLTLHASSSSSSDSRDAATAPTTTLRVDVRGSSLRPACHFDVDRSDYAERRAPHLLGPTGELGPLDPSVRVIEMESLGVRVRNTKRFFVVNPTNVSYEFTWTPVADVSPSFRCATPKGLMLAGKRCEMVFEFTPQQLTLAEMFWRFEIPHFDVRQLFLLVGTTTEPRVLLDRGSVNFNTLLVGTKALQSVALVNHEHLPFHFVVDKAALDFANETPALLVHPLSGVVPPHSRATLDIEFAPTEEKTYNVNLSCLVKRKPTRLSLNIKGEGYSIHDALTIAADDDRSDDARPVLLGASGHNVVDFGAVRVNEEIQRTVVIHNLGKFNFEFSWSAGSGASKLPASVAVEPAHGTVKKTDKVACTLTFAPVKPTTLDGTQLTCTIAGSRTYAFALHGHAVPPSLQFSFTAHDFGPCFVGEPDARPISETAQLSVFNTDADVGVDLDCLFEKKAHLRVECAPTVLGPRESVTIPIVFTPRQETLYAEVVSFTVNGSSTVSVSVRGEGVLPKVELVNPAMQSVAFSALQIGQQVSRSVKIVNRAKRKITVGFVDDDAGSLSFDALNLSLVTPRELTLRPKETADVAFQFAPTKRIPAFQKDVFLDVAGSRRRLVTLWGCCQGVDVSLDTDTLSFGLVCLGSQLVRRVRLQNRGDVSAKFQWNPRDFAPDFAITPLDGSVAPNHHKTIEITFQPVATNPDVRYDRLACVVDGASPVYLTLVGGCVQQAASSIQELHFEARVRETSVKQITIENPSASPWNLRPVMTGEHWTCPESVAVPAEGRASVDIAYCPLRMTMNATRDDADDASESGGGAAATFRRPKQLDGSIFFAIPDGTALLYNVVGKATAPARAGSLALSTPAKKTLAVAVAVRNWLKTAQTFDVAITNPRESMLAQGPASVTVQGGATRTYTLKFFAYTEGDVDLVVRFTNPTSGEYVAYDVHVAVAKAREVETVHLDAPVRQSSKKVVAIENPFDASRVVRFADSDKWWTCSSPTVRVRQLTALSGHSEGAYEVEYRPTLHADTPTDALLTIAFAELGEYTYRLVLATQPAGVERVLHFKVPLGGAQTQSFTFTTFADSAADMVCSVGEPAYFSVPTTLRVDGTAGDWDGKSAAVPVKFEPEALGDVRDTLTVFSESVGEYKCALHGVSVPPLPMGPFVFASTKELEFRNVFSTPMDFDVVVDNPRFVVSAKTLSIPAKASKTISVRVNDHSVATAAAAAGAGKVAPSSSLSVTAKLFVSCPARKELPPWVYYLEATASKQSAA